MPIVIRRWITRADLIANRDSLFAFGDNVAKEGYGGQAREMRGEVNAVGIPTKWMPSNTSGSFFIDRDFDAMMPLIDAAFMKLAAHLRTGGVVIWPAQGVGTGRANLRQVAPLIAAYIDRSFEELQKVTKQQNQPK